MSCNKKAALNCVNEYSHMKNKVFYGILQIIISIEFDKLTLGEVMLNRREHTANCGTSLS
jgi:hypothetical protein